MTWKSADRTHFGLEGTFLSGRHFRAHADHNYYEQYKDEFFVSLPFSLVSKDLSCRRVCGPINSSFTRQCERERLDKRLKVDGVIIFADLFFNDNGYI